MKSVTVSLNRAKKSIHEAEELLKNAPASNALKVEDIYLPLNHLFNAAAKHAFEIQVNQTFVQREIKMVTTTQTKVIDEVRYFGAVAVGERKIFDACQKVANAVNHYADRGFVTGVLCKLIMLQLATEPHQLKRWVVCSYVALSPEGIEYLKTNPTKVEFSVGGLPLNSDDL